MRAFQRHEARFKEAGLPSSQPLESEGALAAHPSEDRRGERSGKSAGKSAASDARTGAPPPGGARLSSTAAVAIIDEPLTSSPTGSPSSKGGKRRQARKLDTVEEDAESEGTSAEGEEEQADSMRGIPVTDSVPRALAVLAVTDSVLTPVTDSV